MTKAGNKEYSSAKDLPDIIPIFPLAGALLLPSGNLPLSIYEPRYLAMVDHVLGGNRLIGMIQPDLEGGEGEYGPDLCKVGCIGRLTGFQESGDGRYLINLTGICRFKVAEEFEPHYGFRQVRISVPGNEFPSTDVTDNADAPINRELVLKTFRQYLEVNEMETDWEAVDQTDDETLVTALCMMSPYGPAEKQALLEAEDLFTRAETLVAITEIELARISAEAGKTLQ